MTGEGSEAKRRRRRKLPVAFAFVALAVALLVAFEVLPSDRVSQAQTPPPEQPPQWIIDAAREMVRQGHATAGYWGLLHDPELGDLTASGPDDPSTKAYAIVLIGEFPGALASMSMLVGASPPPVPHFVVRIYDTATHKSEVYGFGQSFDASKYPSLKPFSLY